MTVDLDERIRSYAVVIDRAIAEDRSSRRPAVRSHRHQTPRRRLTFAVAVAVAVAIAAVITVTRSSDRSKVATGSESSTGPSTTDVGVSSVDLGVSQIWPGNGAAVGTPTEVAVQFTAAVTGETATATVRSSDPGASGPTWIIVTLPSKLAFQVLLVPVKGGWAVAQVGTGVAFTAALDGPAAFHYEPLSQAASYTAFYRIGDAVRIAPTAARRHGRAPSH